MSNLEPVHALNLDLRQQQHFVRYYKNLPSKPPSTVRLFDRTEYYTLHGDDAKLASDYTSFPLKLMGEAPKLSYVVLNKKQFDTFIRELLLIRQYRVEVYTKPAQNKTNDWKLEFKGSPGNLTQFESILFENDNFPLSNAVMAIMVVKEGLLAIGCVNVDESKFEVLELNDNECFSELEMLLAQISPKECIIPLSDTSDLNAVKKVLERNLILVDRVKKSEFHSDNIKQDLDRLLFFPDDTPRNASAIPETNLTHAMDCLQAVITFLNLIRSENNFNQFKLTTIDIHRFVRVDNAALYALNALPPAGSSSIDGSALLPNVGKTSSIMGILDCCSTAQGRRLLEQWIKHPLKDYNSINERLDIVDCLVKDPTTTNILAKNTLTKLPDLLMLAKKLSNKKATLQDCYRVYQTIANVPELVATLQRTENDCVRSLLVDPIGETMIDLNRYQDMIEHLLDFKLVDRGEYFVKATFNEELQELYTEKERIEERIQHLLSKAANHLGFEKHKTIKLDRNDVLGYFFRVTVKEEVVLRNNSRYKIIDVVKGGVRFTSDALKELNETYREIRESYEVQQKEVVKQIFDVAVGYAGTLRTLNLQIATVDVLVSFANAASNASTPYVRPKMHKAGSGILKLKELRHPCLEAQGPFIPNDVYFDGQDKTMHIITGPNMCGKSTYIKSIGACVLMAHMGSLVPCYKAEISVVDAILARVGADDCQLKGLSTFMLEMIEASTIVESATENSLVIIDELGRGTSTYDGCGIAWSIAEHLAKQVKCFTLYATHYHEITRLGDKFPSVGNLHVAAITTNDSITPLYQIREGECDKSYGVHCARMAGFPEDVIQWAIDHQKKLEHSIGTTFMTAYEMSIKRKITEEGDAIVNEALETLKSDRVQSLSEPEFLEFVQKLKGQLQSSNNLFIKGLLSK